ncbi:MAG TPA: N-acetylmuramoyl-L-alanine amidase, partial [Mycobacterium sp.]
MSFTWFAANPLHTRVEWGQTFLRVIRDLGIADERGAFICTAMCAFQEAGATAGDGGPRQIWTPGNLKDPCYKANPDGYPHDSGSDDGYSSGPFQQQMSGPGVTPAWGWGGLWGDPEGTRKRMDAYESTKLFVKALKASGFDATNASTANNSVQRVQQSGVPTAYAQWFGEAQKLYDETLSGNPSPPSEVPVTVSGDPTWLEDVLRPALGDRLKTLPGWQDSGVGGTMGQIWGVIWHHTGNASATAQSIRDGRPDLAGPLSQLHIAQDGTVTIVAVGPCNHAGLGSWVGLPTDGANTRTIGIECAWPRDTTITEATQNREPWPDAQIIAMRDVGAALSLHLGVDASHNISHSEWARFGPAGYRQGKWDPGNIDMNWFRGEIAKDMRGEFDGPPTQPPIKVFPHDYSDRDLLERMAVKIDYIAGQLGPWAQLGHNDKGEPLTLVDWAADH